MPPEVYGASVFIFSVFCEETLSKERACGVSCQVNLRIKHRDPVPKEGGRWCYPTSSHLCATLSFCAWIARWVGVGASVL